MAEKSDFQRVKYLIKVLTKCSGEEADRATTKICQDPEATALLALACGGAIYGTRAGITTAQTGLATGAWPAAISGAAITGVSALAAKRFCLSVVNNSGSSVSKAEKKIFENNLP